MLIGRSLKWLLMMAALSAAVAAAQTTTSGTLTRQTTTPPVGLASSETAQINVVNVATASSSGSAVSCTGTISFLNSSGTVIGTATPFTVTNGQIFSATLPFSDVGVSATRAEIRGEVTVTETSGASHVPCALTSSLETYDATTGVTHLYLAVSGMVINPGGPRLQ
jgi:hypothetical protein